MCPENTDGRERAIAAESTGSEELLRLYPESEPLDEDGYPLAWQEIKVLVRERAGNRCERCRHPYTPGEGQWSRCDQSCNHGQPIRVGAVRRESAILSERAADGESARADERAAITESAVEGERPETSESTEAVEAHWRILTTHHLNGDKLDCRWGNLVALCQRCHLTIQGKVRMDRIWPYEHSAWFKPYAACFYAQKYLGLELGRDEVMLRLGELLALEGQHERLPGVAW